MGLTQDWGPFDLSCIVFIFLARVKDPLMSRHRSDNVLYCKHMAHVQPLVCAFLCSDGVVLLNIETK